MFSDTHGIGRFHMAPRISKPGSRKPAEVENPSTIKGNSRIEIQKFAQVAAAKKLNDARLKEQAVRTTSEVVLRSC